MQEDAGHSHLSLEKQPRPGLVPQSGDWQNPKRWVLPEGETLGPNMPEPDAEISERNPVSESMASRGEWGDTFQSRGALTPGKKLKIQKQLVEKYGDDPDFKEMSIGLAMYTQGFFKGIRSVAAAIATGTLEEFEANATGYFRLGIQEGNDNPTLSIAFASTVKDIFGRSTDNKDEEHDDLSALQYNEAKKYAGHLMKAIDNSEPTDEPLYRGMTIRSLDLEKMRLEVGNTFDIPDPSSFTRREDIASSFANKRAKGQRREKLGGNEVALVLKIEGPTKAIDVDVFSPWKQEEALTNGSFEIVGKEYDKWTQQMVVTLKQKETVGENWEKGRGVEYNLPLAVAKDLTEKTYNVVSDIKHQWDSRGDIDSPMWAFGIGKLEYKDKVVVLDALEKLGFEWDDKNMEVSKSWGGISI